MVQPETKAGVAARLGLADHVVRNWWTRTINKDRPVPKPMIPPKWTDSRGKQLWDGEEIDAWWADHPSNPDFKPEPEPKKKAKGKK